MGKKSVKKNTHQKQIKVCKAKTKVIKMTRNSSDWPVDNIYIYDMFLSSFMFLNKRKHCFYTVSTEYTVNVLQFCMYFRYIRIIQ